MTSRFPVNVNKVPELRRSRTISATTPPPTKGGGLPEMVASAGCPPQTKILATPLQPGHPLSKPLPCSHEFRWNKVVLFRIVTQSLFRDSVQDGLHNKTSPLRPHFLENQMLRHCRVNLGDRCSVSDILESSLYVLE